MRRSKKAKSNFYHVRWNVVGLNEERAAEVLGISTEEVKIFDTEGAPAMAERLLLLWDRKNIGVDGWDGWLFSRGVLMYKKRRWTPKIILDYRNQDEELNRLKNEIHRLKTWRGLSTVFVDKLITMILQKRGK